MRTGCIYMATVNDDLSKCYIGQTLDFPRRKEQHLRCPDDAPIYNAIRKYGTDSVTWQILEDDIPEHRLPAREELWIAFYNTYFHGLNATHGGDGGAVHPDTRAKISKTARAKAARGESPAQRPEVQAKMRAAAQANLAAGKHQTQQPEVRAKMSATAKKKAARGEGPSQNPEAKAKISKAWKALCERGEAPQQQPEIKARISATLKALAARGEHPQQNPEIRTRATATMLRTHVKKRLKQQQDAGQQFLLDMSIKDKL